MSLFGSDLPLNFGIFAAVFPFIPMSKPYNAIDAIRCVLILLVVIVHTVNFGHLHPDFKSAVNFFFMPAFLVVTGYLVNVGCGVRRFGLYLLRIAIPYAILSLGFAALSLFLPVEGGLTELSVRELGRMLLVSPIGPYWYLHAMIVCGILYFAAHSVAGRLGAAAEMCVFGGLLAVVAFLSPLLAFIYAASYFLGAALRLGGADFMRVFPPTAWAVIPFAALMALGRQSGGGFAVLGLTASFFCLVAWGWGRLGGRWARWVGFVGRNTLPVYLFHPIFTMAGKFALPLFAFDPTGIAHMAITLCLAVGGSLALARALDSTGLSRIFGRRFLLR